MRYELVEFGRVSFRDWAQMVKDESTPFGDVPDGLEWRSRDINMAVRDEQGAVLALAGLTVATVEVEGYGRFDVVGTGGLIVRPEARGLGLARLLLQRGWELAKDLGPDRAMLFCEPHLCGMYARIGIQELADPVWVDQPGGRIEMPMSAMWKPVRPVEWPRGTIHLDGLPF